MFLTKNKKGLTFINELQNIAIGAVATIGLFETTEKNYSLVMLAFAMNNPALWATGNGVILRILVDDIVALELESEFSDLKRPANFFVNIQEKQKIEIQVVNNTGVIITDAAIKLDLLVE